MFVGLRQEGERQVQCLRSQELEVGIWVLHPVLQGLELDDSEIMASA